MDWSVYDFLFAFALLGSLIAAIVWAFVRSKDTAYRTAIILLAFTIFIMTWSNMAVGLIGDPSNPLNILFIVLTAFIILGTIITRGSPKAMSLILGVAAAAQITIGAVALLAEYNAPGISNPVWPVDITVLTLFFTGLWLMSAFLFRRSARR